MYPLRFQSKLCDYNAGAFFLKLESRYYFLVNEQEQLFVSF